VLGDPNRKSVFRTVLDALPPLPPHVSHPLNMELPEWTRVSLANTVSLRLNQLRQLGVTPVVVLGSGPSPSKRQHQQAMLDACV